MPITETMAAGQLAAFDQAVAAYRDACRAFAYRTEHSETMAEAEATLRQAGYDAVTGLITLPIAVVHFSDVRADGARMSAVNGSVLGGETWVCWKGRCFRHGVECATYDAYDLIQVRA
jgi:hypothetical protein